jgi:hypothetical protein
VKDTIHPDIDKPTSVTHFICPKSPKKDGVPFESHHLVYPNLSTPAPSTCCYCQLTREELARRNDVP